MKKSVTRWLVLFLFLTLPGLGQAANWQVMTEELPPFNYTEQDQVVGISSDLLVQMCKRAGVPVGRSDIQILPWARAYSNLQKDAQSVLFSMARTEEREKMFKWVGPIYQLEIGLIAAKKSAIRINSPEDLKKYRIGTVIDGAPEQLLVKQGMELAKLDRLPNPENNVKKLEAGRIDLFSFNVPTALYLMKKQGMKLNDYEIVYSLKKAELYFAFSKDVPDATIKALQSALDALKKSGEYERTVARYL